MPLLVAFAALASLVGPAPDTEKRPDLPIEEVVVTAQRREEAARDVPAALTAYSGETLLRLGARDLHDVSLLTPGLLVQEKSPANSNFVLRGVSTDDGSAYQEPRVSVFQDGVSIARSRGAFVELFDVDRIEVVRGPQTTLFGRSALTGAINIVDRLPDPGGRSADLRAEGGSYAYGLVGGALNTPISDTLSVRLAGQYRRRDGYIDNVLGGPALGGFETGALRGSLSWRPSAALKTDVIASYESDRTSGTNYKSKTFLPADPVSGRVLGDLDPSTAVAAAEPAGFPSGERLGDRRRIASLTVLNAYALRPDLKLSSISAARHVQSTETYDLDGFGLPLVGAAEAVRDTQYSQELRLDYDAGGRFSWMVGASGFGDSGRHRVPLQINEPDLLALLTGYLDRRNPVLKPQAQYADPQVGVALLQGLGGAYGVRLAPAQALAIANNLQGSHQETSTDLSRTAAVDLFGDVVFKPTARLSLEAGLRFTHEDKTTGYAANLPNGRSVLAAVLAAFRLPDPLRTSFLSALTVPGIAQIPPSAALPLPLLGLAIQPTVGDGEKVDQSLTDSGVSGRLSARYALTPAVSLYANYAHGRRPEVLTAASPAQPLAPPVFTPASAETLDSFEAGAKARAWNGRLRLDVAVYTNGYSHFQTVQQQGAQLVTIDAGKASTTGVEAQLVVAPTERVQLFANYAFTHARFDAGLYSGNRFRLTPDHALSAGASFSAPAFAGLLTLQPSLSWRSKAFFNDDNANPALVAGALIKPLVYDEVQGAYALVNLRLGYAPRGADWRIEVAATNLLDRSYLKDAGNSGQFFGLPTYVAGEPRMVSVIFSVRR